MSLQVNRSAVAAGLQKAQPNIGSVPGLPLAVEKLQQHKQFGEYTIPITPGLGQVQNIEGDYLFIYSSDFPLGDPTGFRQAISPNNIAPATLFAKDNNGNVMRIDSAGKGYIFPTSFRNLSFFYTQSPITNPFTGNSISPPIITLKAYVGYGRIENDLGTRVTVGAQGASVNIFDRPNNVVAYAAGQVVGPTTPNTVPLFLNMARTPMAGGIITRATVSKSSNNLVNANFSLLLYQASRFPATFPADQSAWAPPYAAGAFGFFQGIINFPTFIVPGTAPAAICDVSGINIPFVTDNTNPPQNGVVANTGIYSPVTFFGGGCLFGVLLANAAYVPIANESFTIQLFTDQY